MRHDYETFRAAFKNLSERQGALVKFVGADWADQATKFFAPVIKFYDLVLKRDRIMSANLLKRFGVDKPVVAILVTGGFHSKGIDEILESKRVSTVVVTPRFSDLTGKENYSHVLKKSK
ncbi:MAG: hypothetical protein HZC17_06725 [Candidatus Omnitrophica bacterium]|nr:hypothetical protein [Candidatus Omnitrophota bacterium]